MKNLKVRNVTLKFDLHDKDIDPIVEMKVYKCQRHTL